MPPTPEQRLVRRCGGNSIQAVNYEPAVQVQQEGWGYKTVNSTALRPTNTTMPLDRILNENEAKDAIQAFQNSGNGGVYMNAGGGDDGCWDGHDHHDGLAAGAIVGIVFGVGILLVLVIVGVWLARKRSKKGAAHGGGGQGGPGFTEKMKQMVGRFKSGRGTGGAGADEEKADVSESHNPARDPYSSSNGY